MSGTFPQHEMVVTIAVVTIALVICSIILVG